MNINNANAHKVYDFYIQLIINSLRTVFKMIVFIILITDMNHIWYIHSFSLPTTARTQTLLLANIQSYYKEVLIIMFCNANYVLCIFIIIDSIKLSNNEKVDPTVPIVKLPSQ